MILRNLKPITSNLKPNAGQMLVEAVMALSVLTVGFLGVVALLSNSLGANRVVSDNYAATSLAAEGIELVKNLIDTNIIRGLAWNQGFSNGEFAMDFTSDALSTTHVNDFLRFDPTTGLYSYTEGTTTKFKRKIQIVLIGQEELRVNSIVTWTSRGGGSSSVNLEDHFLNWRP